MSAKHSRRIGRYLGLALAAIAGACESDIPFPAIDPDALAAADTTDLGTFMNSPCDEIPLANNEVHDCQRLVELEDGQATFGPLMGIMPDRNTVGLPADQYTSALVAARIANAGSVSGDDGYPILGLEEGAGEDELPVGYCLWLRLSGEDDWQAALTRIDTRGTSDCGPAPVDPEIWNQLDVHRMVYSGAGPEDYPPTARWEWTEPGEITAMGQHYIGIRCGAGWCTVGRSGFTPFESTQPLDGSDPMRTIPGWSDSQFLAVMFPPDSPGAELTPGPWGTVFPEDVSGVTDWSDFQTVATFELRPGTPPAGAVAFYRNKLKLPVPAGPNGTHTSWVQLSWDGDPTHDPQARYQNAVGGPTADAKGVTVGATPHGTFGSARWRWHDDDETEWVPCPYYGCCDVEDAF